MHRADGIDAARFGDIPFAPTESLSEVHGKRLTFWTKELLACLEEEGRVALSVQQARLLYTRQDGAWPMGMGRVMAELRHTGACVPLEEYESGGRRSSLGVVVSVVMSPFRWWAGGGGATPHEIGDEKAVLVFEKLVARVARRVLSEVERHGAVFSEAQLEECAARHTGDRALDKRLVLEWLRDRRGLVVAVTPPVNSKQKLCREKDAFVTDLDVTVYQLRSTMEALRAQEEGLSQRSAELREQARVSVREGNKVRATAMLKRKRIVDEALAKRLDVGTNVALVLSRVETAQAENMALAALKTGVDALRAAHIDPEEVGNVLEEFGQLQAVQDEVSDVFAANAMGDVDELEQELAALCVADTPQPAAAAKSKPAVTEPLAAGAQKEAVAGAQPAVATAKKKLVME